MDSKSPFAFGSYIYVQGADDMPGNSLYRYGAAQHLPNLDTMDASHGKLVSISGDAQGLKAVLTSSAPNTPDIQLEITLPAAERGIELTYRLQKTATLRKEAAYFAFSFAGDHPKFGYESQNGWIDPALMSS